MSVSDGVSASVRPNTDPPLDPRGVRFAAILTTIVLALVLISGSGWLAAAQALVFALAAFAGMRFAPYAVLYRKAIAPRLGPPRSGRRPRRSGSARPSGSCSPPWVRSDTSPG